jgi:hypothetical protein
MCFQTYEGFVIFRNNNNDIQDLLPENDYGQLISQVTPPRW